MYTKGLWELISVSQDDKAFHYLKATEEYQITVGGNAIAVMGQSWASGNAKANAHLIAASPSMYEFIKGRADGLDKEAIKLIETLDLKVEK